MDDDEFVGVVAGPIVVGVVEAEAIVDIIAKKISRHFQITNLLKIKRGKSQNGVLTAGCGLAGSSNRSRCS
jgi:hypothetical protein